MDIFDFLTMLGGLSLFLFGMSVMGQGLERAAGSKLKTILERLTSSPVKGFFLGVVVTAVIQSSSATTVMVVGFVNSGVMKLTQAVGIIMGANVGTTVTAWLISLAGLEGDGIIQLFKPSSFSPILAVIGVVFYVFLNNSKKKDIGAILLGFATLMFGMETMVRRGGRPGRCARLYQHPADVLQPHFGRAGRSCPHCHHPVLLRFGGNPSGPVLHWRSDLWQCHSHHHGPEYRHHRHRHALFRGRQ